MRDETFELLKKGHHCALENIYAQYSRSIFWVGKRLIDDEFVIESLVQDAFLKLWMHRDSIQSPEHIFFFLRFVMKRECISYYTRPKHKFYRKINSLENFENYQEYIPGDDPLKDNEALKDQEQQQKDFERIERVLSLLEPERRSLIGLCLKYGFCYKEIAGAMGISTTEASNEVKRAIRDIKNIIHQGSQLETQKKSAKIEVREALTEEQAEILKLRCDEKFSFAAIASELKLTQKEVHTAFVSAYKILQQRQEEEQLQPA